MTLLLLLLGCPETVSTKDTSDHFPEDVDADGWSKDEGDCDDEDRAINPGAAEVWYDGTDQNCDGNDDDQDGDGVKVDKDCDDTQATVYPRADELCDGLDNDCDGTIDDNAEGGTEVWEDADGDGYAADNADSMTVCDGKAPVGYSLEKGDCNDNNAGQAPDEPEVCDRKDNDCDGETDEGAVDAPAAYVDADGDGFGRDGDFVRACTVPDGYVEDNTDCNDNDPTANPDGTELCDGADNDCNGLVDDDAADATTVYADIDSDGFGDPTAGFTGCSSSGVADASDCDDTVPTTFPGAPEQCDGLDNDCDTLVDNDVTYQDYYVDGDGDGYGAGAVAMNDCTAPAGFAPNATDCDDGDATISPAGHEICNEVDDDCDGGVDIDALDASAFYLDTDADGYGVTADFMVLCAADGDYSASLTDDCDDAEESVYPGAAESDNNTDDDCDSLIDEDFVAEGDLVITEIARQTWMGGTSTNTDGQWFELYNSTGDTLYLSGFTVTRTSTVGTDTFDVDPAEGVTIPAGDMAVFCATDLYTSANDTNSLLECDYVWGDPTLPSTYSDSYLDNTFHIQRDEDTLSVSVAGLTIDSVSWDATWPQEATAAMALASGSDASANDLSVNWAMDVTNPWWDGGTPNEYGTPGWWP